MVLPILIVIFSLVILGTIVSFFYNDFWKAIQKQSLSMAEINVLKTSKHDANGFIKEFYDFKYKNISTCLKGTTSVFALCVGSLVKIAFENSNFNPWNTPHLLLTMIVFLLIIINALLVSELVSCNAEYAHAIIEYES